MVNYICEGVDFSFSGKRKCSEWLKNTAEEEKKRIGDISVVFTYDDHLLEINRRYLHHDYYTDIITFDYSEGDTVSGDLMISVDTVRANAEEYGDGFEKELYRVVVHGLLHLIGYDDSTEAQQKKMRAKEDYYLSKRK